MKILIVEGEQKTGDYLKQGLSEASFVVDLVRDSLDGMHLALTDDYDLVVLDVMVPRLDGWQVLKGTQHARSSFFPENAKIARDARSHHELDI